MDWMVVGGIFLAGWLILSVLSSERMRRSQAIAVALATAATEKTRADADVPIAMVTKFAAPLPKAAAQPAGKPAAKPAH